MLPISSGGLFAHELNVNEDFMQLIAEVRQIANDDWTPPSAAIGSPFEYWDQYRELRSVIENAIMYALFCAFGSCAILIFLVAEHDEQVGACTRAKVAVHGAGLITGTIAMMVYELYGMCAWIGIKMSAIPAISIILGVGVGVEFTAHLVLAFINASGTRDQRVVKMLNLMFIPTIDGGTTSVLAVIMLAFSPFVFIIKYFFSIYVIMVALGFINGLFVLPVIVSIIGPETMSSAEEGFSSTGNEGKITVLTEKTDKSSDQA
jgi:patched 1 protein